MNIEIVIEVLQHALMITGFVMLIMLIIEYLNVQTKGKWSMKLKSSPWIQILVAGLLGIIPGCLGTFTAVSLFSHQIMNFAALVTVMIASSGDEAFLMLALIPDSFLKITFIIFGIAVITGLLLNFIPRIANFQPFGPNHKFSLHQEEEDCVCLERKKIFRHLKKLSVLRVLFSSGVIILSAVIFFGIIGPDEWNWIRITLLLALLFVLFIILTVPEHFLSEHIWQHVIVKHFLQIFLWSFGTLLVVHVLESRIDLGNWIQGNLHIVLIFALIVGLVPESGPHMVFISLFVAGTIPLSVLIANSIVQDGHGSLPLLAESKKSFFLMKSINIIIGLLVGLIGIYSGW